MKDNYKQYKIRMAKSGALSLDIVAIWLIAVLTYIFFQLGFINLTGFECKIPYLEPYGTDIGEWNKSVEAFCESNFIVRIGGYVLLSYALLSAFCIASPMKSTPIQYLAGKCKLKASTFFMGMRGKEPEIHEAMKLMLVSRHLFPWYLLFLYHMLYDFKTSLYNGGGSFWVIITLIIGLRLYERFSASELSWDERFSGLRVHLTKGGTAQIDRQVK